MSTVRIVSDGTTVGSSVSIDGRVLEDVTYVEWGLSASGVPRATIVLEGHIELEFEGEGRVQ